MTLFNRTVFEIPKKKEQEISVEYNIKLSNSKPEEDSFFTDEQKDWACEKIKELENEPMLKYNHDRLSGTSYSCYCGLHPSICICRKPVIIMNFLKKFILEGDD